MTLHFRVSQQIIVDLFGAAELHVGLTTRGEHPRMRAIPGIVVDDVLESAHPPVYSEQIEGKVPFDDASKFIWTLTKMNDSKYELITSRYWIEKEDIIETEYESNIVISEEED